MNDAKESGSAAKQTRLSNEQLLEKLEKSYEKLAASIEAIRADIEVLKVKTGSRDKPVEGPKKENYNTDPGPWQKKPADPAEVEARVQEYKNNLVGNSRR